MNFPLKMGRPTIKNEPKYEALKDKDALVILTDWSQFKSPDLEKIKNELKSPLIFDTRNNPNLTCILVDDVNYSTTNWTNIDPQTSFSSTYCRYTAILDANFEARLETLGYDDISGDG